MVRVKRGNVARKRRNKILTIASPKNILLSIESLLAQLIIIFKMNSN